MKQKKPKEMDLSGDVRCRIFYKGRVQGVGFRFNAETIALDIGVTGWVKNIESGGVEVLVEGSQNNVDKFLDGIRKSRVGHFIQSEKIKTEGFEGEFTDFRIEYDF